MSKECVTLYFRQGSSDKTYYAAVDERPGGYVVNFAYGRRGSTLQTGTKTHMPVSLDAAKKIFDQLVKEKMAKGYTPGASGVAYACTENAQRSTEIRPQLLNPIDEDQVKKLIADPAFWMQQKYDGKRILIQRASEVTGINRRGLTVALPESIAQSAAEIRVPCIIDGEAIGDRYYAFDLLELNGENFRGLPYRERYVNLAGLINEGVGALEVVDAWGVTVQKREAFDRLKQANAEGVVFKRSDAPHTPGRPASGGSQLKHKFVADGTFIVAGVNAGKRSIGLEIFNVSGQRQYVGNVTVPPNQKMPKVGALVEIRYLYAFREGCLFQPVLLGIRDDIDASACTAIQLKFKPEEDDDAGV